MTDLNDFKEWLMNNKVYSNRTMSNIVSRFKRANALLEWYDDDVYLFKLEQVDGFKNLSVTVKSQIRKAVKLYHEYQMSKKER